MSCFVWDLRRSTNTPALFHEQFKKIAFLFAVLAAASAFVPSQNPSFVNPTRLFMEYGKYDEKLWDMTAKLDVYSSWNPGAPRSPLNFNPFETFEGNSPDASGFYPGENRYKDPVRGDVNFQQMMEERKILEDIAANPKPGSAPGCPGCRK
jgi:hypothetical protein